jgi:hypothetical protein
MVNFGQMNKQQPQAAAPAQVTGDVLTVDFTGVDVSTRDFSIPDGTYAVAVLDVPQVKVYQPTGPNSKIPAGTKFIEFVLQIQGRDDGDTTHQGLRLWHKCYLQPQQLWVLRKTLECLGIPTQAGMNQIPLSECKGLWMGVKVVNKKSGEKMYPNITEMFSLATQEDQAQAAPVDGGSL